MTWQQWSQKWGSWSVWRASCPTFHGAPCDDGRDNTLAESLCTTSQKVVSRPVGSEAKPGSLTMRGFGESYHNVVT